MMRRIQTGGLLALLIAVAGCSTSYTMAPPAAPPPVEAAFQTAALVLPAQASPEHDPAVAEFIRSHARIGAGPLLVSAPSAPAMESAQAVLDASGAAGEILYETYKPSTADAPVILSFRHYSAEAPGCGAAAGFGCATRSNLAAQISDPRDLADPRVMSPADVARREAVLQAWRAGQPTAASRTADESGAISDAFSQ